MALSVDERQQFLAEPHVAALSVSEGLERGPLTVPIWYQYTPGGDLWVATSLASKKAELIQAAGYFSLMVERVEPTVRYVSVSGPVAGIVALTDELHLELVRRYLPEDQVQPYLTKAESFGEQVAIYLTPQHWLSADLGGAADFD